MPLPPYILQAGYGWHAGVIGIVAGRLKDKYHRPTFVIAFDEDGLGKGSARSISSVDVGRLVAGAVDEKLIEAGGGHAMAAGVTLRREQLPAFEAYLGEALGTMALDAPRRLRLDASLTPQAATRDLWEPCNKSALSVPETLNRALFFRLLMSSIMVLSVMAMCVVFWLVPGRAIEGNGLYVSAGRSAYVAANDARADSYCRIFARR